MCSVLPRVACYCEGPRQEICRQTPVEYRQVLLRTHNLEQRRQCLLLITLVIGDHGMFGSNSRYHMGLGLFAWLT